MAATVTGLTSTVFGAVNGSIGSINVIISWIDRLESFIRQCGEASETICDISDLIEARKQELDQWKDLWTINNTTKFGYMKELWGESPLKRIKKKIMAIEELSNNFNDLLEEFCGKSEVRRLLDDALERNNSASNWQLQAAFLEDKKRHFTVPQIIKFVRNTKPRAMDWLTRLDTNLAELSNISNKAFFAKHRERVSDGLTMDQADMVRRLAFLQMAMGLRCAAEELFQLCLQAEESICLENNPLSPARHSTRLKLDLAGTSGTVNLNNIPSQSGIQLIYHLLLKWETPAKEICLEGPLPHLDQARIVWSFLDAYREIQNNRLTAILVKDNYFPCRGPTDQETLRLDQLEETISPPKSLAELISVSDMCDAQDILDELPRSQRFYLAFKISECGLYLGGTSWLSNLKSRHIRRFTIDQASYCYTLDACKPQRQSWQVFNQLGNQMFRLGIILVELGTGHLVRGFENGNSSNQHDVVLRLCKQDTGNNEDGEYHTLSYIMKILARNMGDNYTSATQCCIGEIRDMCGEASRESAQDAIDNALKSIFDKFFVKVYTPLGELAALTLWNDNLLQDIQPDGF